MFICDIIKRLNMNPRHFKQLLQDTVLVWDRLPWKERHWRPQSFPRVPFLLEVIWWSIPPGFAVKTRMKAKKS